MIEMMQKFVKIVTWQKEIIRMTLVKEK